MSIESVCNISFSIVKVKSVFLLLFDWQTAKLKAKALEQFKPWRWEVMECRALRDLTQSSLWFDMCCQNCCES